MLQTCPIGSKTEASGTIMFRRLCVQDEDDGIRLLPVTTSRDRILWYARCCFRGCR